jgi:hypothetical protein
MSARNRSSNLGPSTKSATSSASFPKLTNIRRRTALTNFPADLRPSTFKRSGSSHHTLEAVRFFAVVTAQAGRSSCASRSACTQSELLTIRNIFSRFATETIPSHIKYPHCRPKRHGLNANGFSPGCQLPQSQMDHVGSHAPSSKGRTPIG